MKNLILILTIAITFIATSCSKLSEKGCTDIFADNYSATATDNEGCVYLKKMDGVYGGDLYNYTDEALKTPTTTTPSIPLTATIELVSGKREIRIKDQETLYFTDEKSISNSHNVFNIETKTVSGVKYEALKKYTTGGVSYSGRWLKSGSKKIIVYFKKTNGGTVTYHKYETSF